MSGIAVKVEGLRETVRKFEKAGVEVNDLKDAFLKVGTMVVTASRPYTPVLSGKLRQSIRASRTKNKSVVRAGYPSWRPYAPIQHFGGYHNIEGKEYLYKGLDAKRGAVLTTLSQGVNDAIRRSGL